jgi:hypothetical protein
MRFQANHVAPALPEHAPADVIAGIAALLRSMPGPDAPTPEVVAWLHRKADLFDRITDAASTERLAAEAAATAAGTRTTIAELTATVPLVPGSRGSRSLTRPATVPATGAAVTR